MLAKKDIHSDKCFKEKRSAVKDVVLVLLVLILSVGAGAFVFLGSDMHRLNNIKQQLGDIYDVTFADDGAISESNVFSVTSSDGVGVIGTCNWMGKIETETYVHHYYGIVSAHRISDEIGACFDECVIVANNEYQHLWKQYIATDTLKSYDDYLASFEMSDIPCVFVYVRETENIDHVEEALSILKINNETLKVIICALSDDKYEAHRDFGQKVYTGGLFMDNLNDSRGSDYHENFMLETVFNHEGEVGLYSTGLYGISCKYCVNNEWIDI